VLGLEVARGPADVDAPKRDREEFGVEAYQLDNKMVK
jgi:hypothetical protein